MSFEILHLQDARKGRARLQCPVCDAFNDRPWIDHGCTHCGAGASQQPAVVWLSHGADGLHAYKPDASGEDEAACGGVLLTASLACAQIEQSPTRRQCCADCWARVT